MNAPFFVIGSPRSGTSLFRLMLTCHPELIVPPECGFALWLQAGFGDWQAGDHEDRLESFLTELAASKKMETWGLDLEPLRLHLRQDAPADYAALVRSVYTGYAAQKSKGDISRWGDKNNYYLKHIPELLALFPEASFLHIIRDPRNVVCSYREVMDAGYSSVYTPNLPTACAEAAGVWDEDIRLIRDSLLNCTRVQELRYEDLLRCTEAELHKVCAFLEVPFHEDMLNYSRLNRSGELEPRATLEWKSKTLHPPDLSRIDRYVRDLSPEQVAEVESVAGEMMATYGYLPGS